MTVQRIITGPDPRLTQVSEPFDFARDGQILTDLVDTLRASQRAMALSAVQIGHLVRAFAMKGPNGISVFVNPVITWTSGIMQTEVENCMSYLYLTTVKVTRPVSGSVTWWDHDNVERHDNFRGLPFRVIQHEIWHLDGITIDSYRRAKRV